MAAELNRAKFGAGICTTLDDVIQGLQLMDAALDYPTTPTSSTANTVVNVWYDGANLVDAAGNVVSVTSTTLEVRWETTPIEAAAIALDFTGSAVSNVTTSAGVVTIQIDDSGLTPSVDCFKTITFSNADGTVAANIVADSDADTLNIVAEVGLIITTNASNDTMTLSPAVPYVEVQGLATAAYTPGTGTINIDNVTAINGVSPVGLSSHVLECASEVNIYCADNDVLYANYNVQAGGTTFERWSIANMKNLRPILAGLPDYAPASNMLLGHPANSTDSSQQKVSWKTTEDWLKLITGYSAGSGQYLKNDSGTIKWVTASECD